MKYTLIAWLIIFSQTGFSQSDEHKIILIIDNLFKGMKNEDSSLVHSLFIPSAQLQTISIKNGETIIANEKLEDFIKAVGTPHKKIWDEKVSGYEIKIDDNLATAWTKYNFYYGMELYHCGVNAFQFVKFDDNWKITQITDTRNKENCVEFFIKDSLLKISLNKFIAQWHNDASIGNTAYFDKIAKNGIYIGTDATELWTKNKFYNFAKKFFEDDKAWDFKTKDRNIYLSEEKQYAWFDELLDTWMGDCRASGVLHKTNAEWEIEHYHLSVTVPNDIVKEFIELKSK